MHPGNYCIVRMETHISNTLALEMKIGIHPHSQNILMSLIKSNIQNVNFLIIFFDNF